MAMNLTLDESAEFLTKRTTLGNIEQCRKKLIEKTLAGEIEISVRLPKGTLAMHGIFKSSADIDPDKDTSTSLLLDGVGSLTPWTPPLYTMPRREGGHDVGLIQDCRFEFTSQAMRPIHGVFDLFMVGIGPFLVEQLIDPSFERPPFEDLGGIFVKRPSDGSIFELQVEGQVSIDGKESVVMAPAGDMPAGSDFVFRRDILNSLLELYSPLAAKQGDAPLSPLNRARFKTPGYVTGTEELTRAFGLAVNSITAVRDRVKKAGYSFDIDPITKEKRLTLMIVHDILATKAAKKK